MSIKLDLKIFLFFLLFFITSQINIYILLMTFACIHEITHLLVGIILGFIPQELKITPVGFQIGFKVKCEEYNKKILKGNSLGIKKAIIALAGPIINFLIAILIVVLQSTHIIDLENNLYQNIVYANLLIGLFNLIPIYPLDGGRIVNELLHITVGLKKSYQYTYKVSKATIILLTVISSIAILYLKNISILLILLYLWILIIKERRIYHARERIFDLEEKMKGKEIFQSTDISYNELDRYNKKACKINKSMIK